MSVVQWLQRAGEFQLAEQLGFNGVVATYKGYQPDTKAFACVVALDRTEAGDSRGWPRFVQEFTAVQKPPAGPIVRGLKYGEEPKFYWAAYEFLLRGRHLGHIVQESGLPPVPQAFEVMAQVVEALTALHSMGIPHRIVTPATIFLNDVQQVKLLYAGWTSLILGIKEGAAHPNFMSNLPFLAPEIAAGNEGDKASDVFSVGANLFFLLTGQPIHWTDDPGELASMIASRPINFSPLSNVVKGSAAEVVEELLEMDPRNRPMNLEALAARLHSISGSLAAPQPAVSAPALDMPEKEAPRSRTPTPYEEFADEQEEVTRPDLADMETPKEDHPTPPRVPLPDLGPEPEPERVLAPVEAEFVAPPPPPPRPIAPEPPRATPTRMPARPPRSTEKFTRGVLIFWIVAGCLFIAAALGAGAWMILSDSMKTQAAPAAKAEQETAERARTEAQLQRRAIEQLRELGRLHREYIRRYGIWSRNFEDLRTVGAPDELLEDPWGTEIDIRESFLVIAGPDRKWDTRDDLWIDASSLQLGGAAAP